MKAVEIQNISLRTHSSSGRTHIEFVDSQGDRRLGRILPVGIPVKYLRNLYSRIGISAAILIPDGLSELPDGSKCLSIRTDNLPPLAGGQKLTELIKPLRVLHESGMNHLSIDEYCFRQREGSISLIFWGDGLLAVHPDAPCEVRSGGIPGAPSDLYMLAATALRLNWLVDPHEVDKAKELCSNSVQKRWGSSENYGYGSGVRLNLRPPPPKLGLNIVQGGSWEARDLFVNHLSSIASRKGWICRIIRFAPGEIGRPLPDMPPGTLTHNPGELLKNAFSGQGGIEKLLIINDFSEDQEDFADLLRKLSRIIPSSLRLVLCGASIPPDFHGHRITLSGPITTAVDLPMEDAPHNAVIRSSGCSWYGPRCRISTEAAYEIDKPFLSEETLFTEGAWIYTTCQPCRGSTDRKAESLFNLNRYTEALQFVSKGNMTLRSRILMALGKFDKAAELLSDSKEVILLTEAYMGLGDIHKALDIVRNSSDPLSLPLMARLHDLSGTPASALQPLKEGLRKAEGTDKIDIYCALRNLEMRIGIHEEALKHAESAVALARGLASVPHLVKSLQERGRTLQVTGNWRRALEDYRTAVQFHDESALSFTRPPHVDMFVLELKMGFIFAARETMSKLENYSASGGILQKQMLNMLKAYRGVLLGSGELALPHALRAAELAGRHDMMLYSGISTLYAGQLYIQAGDRSRGLDLIRQARSRGHVLGDKHLVCLTEIELLLNQETRNLSESDMGDLAGELLEEFAAMQIISGADKEEGFRQLLALPSPFLACRLAENCGLPDNLHTKESIIRWKKDILDQLNERERKNYNDLFETDWDTVSSNQFTEPVINSKLRIISKWIQSHLEGESSLSDLAKSLTLRKISITEDQGMIPVPGSNPLYCCGSTASEVAPFLEPVAAVLAASPAKKLLPRRKDKLSDTIIGDSIGIRKIRFELERVAQENVPVLISGETGTGKELCARAIHMGSQRKRGNFVPVDCGAIPETLMESEFFGAARGAYTGVNFPRKGLLEEAHNGTLFLDEIGNLPLHMQAKLLRVLDTGVFRRLGETRERTTDIRLVAATNSNVEKQISDGSFRTDLYYRISVVRIDLPPLRKRLEDIPMLVSHFTEKSITRGALDLLSLHRWPGNIRELSNVLKRASIASAGDTIKRSHISFNTIASEDPDTLTLHEAMRKHIWQTVESFGGSRTKAAKALKCDPKTIRKYLAEDD